MLTGDEIRRARQKAGLSQQELADRVGSTLRSVGNWERGETSATRKEQALRAALAGFWDSDTQGGAGSLHEVSDVELIGELARRLGHPASRKPQRKAVTHNDSETPIDELAERRDHDEPRMPTHDEFLAMAGDTARDDQRQQREQEWDERGEENQDPGEGE